MSSEKKLKILRALDSGEITKDQAIKLMDKHGIQYKKQEPEVIWLLETLLSGGSVPIAVLITNMRNPSPFVRTRTRTVIRAIIAMHSF